MSNKARIREEAKKLNPIDDLMFRKMAEDPKFCEEILRVILSDPGLIVHRIPSPICRNKSAGAFRDP